MATDLYIISNSIPISKSDFLDKLDAIIIALKALNLSSAYNLNLQNVEGGWQYEFPEVYDEVTDSIVPDDEASEFVYILSSYGFCIRLYSNCLELTTNYKYCFLYEDEKTEYFQEFRKEILSIISVFGGTEIIYLADNGCDKLSTYLELWTWKGKSYQEIKQDMIKKKLPFRKDYNNLKLDDLNYNDIYEIIYDDFIIES